MEDDIYTLFSYWSAAHIAYAFLLPTPASFAWDGSLFAITPPASRKRSCDLDQDSASSPAKKLRTSVTVVTEELPVTLPIDRRALARHQLERKQRQVPVAAKPYSLLADSPTPTVVVPDSMFVEEVVEVVEEVESIVEEMEDVVELSMAMEVTDESTMRLEKHSIDSDGDSNRKRTRFNHSPPSSETRRWETVVFKRSLEVKRVCRLTTPRRSSADRRRAVV